MLYKKFNVLKLEKSYRSHVLKVAAFSLSFVLIISCTKERKVNISTENNNTTGTNSNSNPNPTDTGKLTYLALGDSYTIGQSVLDWERFPVQLVNLLLNNRIKIDTPDIIAVTGWTTQNLLNALKNNPPKINYSLVTLLIGVNNQYQGRTLEEYRTQFSQILTLAISYADNKKDHVFVLSIPDYGVTPFGNNIDKVKTARQIDQFNEANKMISQNAGVNYLDITPISRNAENDASLIAVMVFILLQNNI